MGELYAGFDETLGRRVALKAIRAEHRLHPQARARFLREARVLSQLDHPNICRLYDYLEHAGRDFLVLELIEGRSLEQAIRDGLSRERQMAVAEGIAAALVAAHAEGVVHRDLKPPNVMLTTAGEVKVLDFGLAWMERRRGLAEAEAASVGGEVAADGPPTEEAWAMPPGGPSGKPATGGSPTPGLDRTMPRSSGADDPFTARDAAAAPAPAETPGYPSTAASATAAEATVRGTVMGTPAWLSPEQARGVSATTASDMYAFGLLLQALFTGRSPHPPGLAPAALVARALQNETLPPTGAPKEIAALIGRLVAAAPAARPTAVEAAARLAVIRETPRRRLRRLAAAALVAIAILGGVKYTLDLRHERSLAVAARAEAEHRRGQAEDLVGFMLGDLRERLEPVGRLDALDGVADKALDYFASLDPEELDDDDLFRRSKALTQIGEVRVAQGDLEAAGRSLEEAHALASGLVARRPDAGDWLLGLGAIEFWLGNVAWLRGDLPAAEERFRAYLAVAERLVALDATNPDFRLELAYAHSNLGTIQQARGEHRGALDHFRRTIDAKRQLAESDPDNLEWQRELASSLSWLGQTLLAEGELGEAIRHYEDGLGILVRLAARRPDDTQVRYLLAIAHHKVGAAREMREAGDAALRHLEVSLALCRELVALDPANGDWRREAAIGDQWLGRALSRRRPGDGLDHLRRAVARLEDLLAADPSHTERRLDVVYARTDLAHALAAAGQSAAAVAEAERGVAHLAALPAAEGADRRREIEGRAWLGLGDARRAAGRPPEARAAWEHAAEVLAPVAAGSRDPRLVGPYAGALVRLDRAEEAAALTARPAGSADRPENPAGRRTARPPAT